MRKPSPNPQKTSWKERAITECRGLFTRITALARGLKLLHVSLAAALVLALLVASIFILPHLGQRSAVKPATLSAAAVPEASALPDHAKIEPKQNATRTERKNASQANNPKANPVSKAENGPGKSQAVAAIATPTVRSAPPVQSVKEAGEEENSETVRKRASWFFDQRAYPNKHIPAGALQKAIEQRDAMRVQQRAAFNPGTGANAIISFPGDALWHLMGPQPVDNSTFGLNGGSPTASGRVTAIAVDPTNANIVYIGGAAGGVWKTTNGGTNWTALTDTQASLAIGSIAIDPNSCSPAPCTTIYVGTGEDNFNGDAYYGAGILKSTNGGSTWTQLGASTFAQLLGSAAGGAQIGGIAVQPGNPSVILASVFFFDGNDPNGGIWQSLDAGATWRRPATGAQGAAGTGVFFESKVVPPATVPVAWAALGDVFPGATNNGIWKSTDSGANWTKQTGGLPTTNVGRITLGYAAGTSGATATVYAAIADSSTTSSNLLGLFETINGGTAWTPLTSPGGANGFCAQQCFYDMAIGVNPTNANVVVLGGGPGPDNFTSLFESQNGGSTWTPTSSGGVPVAGNFANGSTSTHVHVDTHAIVFTPSGATLFVGDDGGMWSTSVVRRNSGHLWKRRD